jgi:hypothetical protein
VDTNKNLTIGGSDEPAALIELRSIGGLKGPNGKIVVENLTQLVVSELKLPIEMFGNLLGMTSLQIAFRFYINLFDLDPELVAYKGELRSVTMSR